MTIKEFAKLCACNTQTLRYYDRIDLLKPAKVDPWSGYRYYDSAQAIDFVKIRNLQAADFSIQQIKHLLTQPDLQVYEAFEEKLAQQERKLERIREIQKSYLAEKATMEQIVYAMTDYILGQCNHPQVLTEFGLPPTEAPQILALLRRYLNRHMGTAAPGEAPTLKINDEVVRGHDAVLERIHSLTEENTKDTILLNQGPVHRTEDGAQSEPDFAGWECLWERRGWAHVSEFIGALPPLDPGYAYALWVRTPAVNGAEDLSFPLFFLGAVLYRQNREDIAINCSVSASEGRENCFRLLCKQAT